MSILEKRKLQRENRKLRKHLAACLKLIEDLSNLEAPLFEADLPWTFKTDYVRVVNRAKAALKE